MKKEKLLFQDRELSWLSFNYRVLQEAKNTSVPLYERIKFLAIWSSNLDEFFRVRVASLRSLLSLRNSKKKLNIDPADLLKKIYTEVNKQQEEFGFIFRKQILKELEENKIFLVDENNLSAEQQQYVLEYFDSKVIHHIQPLLLVKKKVLPFLQNQRLYLAVKLAPLIKGNSDKRVKHTYSLVEIPENSLPRFVELPNKNGNNYIMFLDEIIRFNLQKVFSQFRIEEAVSVKLTRDAELYIDDEFSGDLLQKKKKSLSKRNTGVSSRFLFDENISKNFRKYLRGALNLTKDDMIPGAKYHNFSDFFGFPNPTKGKLEYEPMPALQLKEFANIKDKFELIANQDRVLFFPYQSYTHVVDFFDEAANDPDVKSIKITQYRVAQNSAIIKSLIQAKNNGKDVSVFVELKARFDEERNILWAGEMEKAGIKVYYSFPGLKVHAKIALVERNENGKIKSYCYLATGNFNEKTAKIYSDMGIFTADERITNEVSKVFKYLSRGKISHKFEHLLVAQFNMRKSFGDLITREIDNAMEGKEAKITIKLNSLEDERMIKKLYKASQAGVKINIIVRGICTLIPGIKGLSENINIISIVDRFLEHARFYIFHNNGDELIFAASADWMKRNLSRRVEVAFPIFDSEIKKKIRTVIDLQLSDNVKARIINQKNKNNFVENDLSKIRSQYATYDFLKSIS